MALGLIDSATVFEVVTLARKSAPRDDWAFRAAYSATASLVFTHHIGVPASQVRSGVSGGPYRKLMSGIEGLGVPLAFGTTEGTASAGKRVDEWAKGDVGVGAAVESLQSDASFRTWLRGEADHVWVEYARRMNGLFPAFHIPIIARELRVSEAELRALHNATLDLQQVRALSEGKDASGSRLLCDAYVASTLVRGRYYCELARSEKKQLVRHPLRLAASARPITSDLMSTEPDRLVCSRAETLFLRLLLATIFCESDLERRIELWIENVGRARTGLLDLNGDLRRDLRTSRSRAAGGDEEAVIRAAKALGIRTHGRTLTSTIDVALSVAATGFGAFYLSGWSDFALGTVATAVAAAGAVPRVARAVRLRRSRLERLMSRPAGALDLS